MAKAPIVSTTPAAILSSEKFEVKITKEEIAETVVADLEHQWHLRIEELEARNKEIDKETKISLPKLVLEAFDKIREELLVKYSETRGKLNALGLELTFKYSPNLIEHTVQAHVLSLDKPMNLGCSPDETLFDVSSEEKAMKKLEDKLADKKVKLGEELYANQQELASLKMNLQKLPRYQRYIKSQLTKKALSTSSEGKDILDLIGKSLPILPEKN